MRNRFCTRPLFAAIAIVTSGGIQSAYGGGLYIGEFGQPNQGASRAGAHALAEDASTAAQNTAGVMFLEQPELMVTGFLVASEIEFEQDEQVSSAPPAVANADGTRPASDGGDAGGESLGGTVFYARPVDDRWGWGISLASVSAAVLDHDDKQDFAGRYWATEVDLLTVTALPSVSYKLSDNFSIGIGLPVMYAQLDMDVVIPGVTAGAAEGLAEIEDGDDVVVGFNASALWQVNDGLRLGVHYVSEMELDFDSDLTLTTPPGVPVSDVTSSVEFSFPQTVRTSLTQDVSPNLTLLANVAWEEWSSFEDIAISTPVGGGALPRNWDDTWHYALGLRWKPDTRWTYYTGIAYDTDPTSASDRTTDMPIDEQWRLSGGVTFQRDNGHKVGAVLTYADYGDAEIANGGNRPGPAGSSWTVNGNYASNQLIFLGLNYSW